MRAVVKRSAEPTDLGHQEVPIPDLSDDEVLVRLHAIGVGIHDSYFLPKDLSYPYPIGIEGAGTVERVGGDVRGYQPGDRIAVVSAMQPKGGTWAEFAAVRADSLIVPIPAGMSFAEAAALPVAGNTALKALGALPLSAGDTVFIAGASGAIGTLAIQLAKRRGLCVAASASAANQEYMQELGADKTVDYRDADWQKQVRAWAPGGVAGAVAIQPDTGAESMRVVRDGGTVVMVSGDDASTERGITATHLPHVDIRAELTQLLSDVADGVIMLTIERTYPFDDALQALSKTQTRHARGKNVVVLD